MQKTIRLKNGRKLTACFTLVRPKVRRWIVFVPESASDFQKGTRQELRELVGGKYARRFNFLAMNKPGLKPRGVDAAVFERSFRHERRVDDALTTMREIIPADHEILIIGYSEGAYLAPEIASRDARVKAVMMIGGGTRGWLKEEVSNASRKQRGEVLEKIKDIYKNPRATRKWQGFSYATWYSYREDHTLHALKRLQIPVLAVLGARDRTIDLPSALRDLKQLRKTKAVRLRVFHDCGHSFKGHWKAVRKTVARFLRSVPDNA